MEYGYSHHCLICRTVIYKGGDNNSLVDQYNYFIGCRSEGSFREDNVFQRAIGKTRISKIVLNFEVAVCRRKEVCKTVKVSSMVQCHCQIAVSDCAGWKKLLSLSRWWRDTCVSKGINRVLEIGLHMNSNHTRQSSRYCRSTTNVDLTFVLTLWRRMLNNSPSPRRCPVSWWTATCDMQKQPVILRRV